MDGRQEEKAEISKTFDMAVNNRVSVDSFKRVWNNTERQRETGTETQIDRQTEREREIKKGSY